jgi:thymidylate synthase (FAD)
MRQTVLDHGYVELVETWGNEERIIEAARMSTGRGFEGWEKDEKLLAFLFRNHHDTPFEMAGMTIEVKAPIMVFREWHRHRTQSYNEMSARYIPLPDENYLPTARRCVPDLETANRQAMGAAPKMPAGADIIAWLEQLTWLYAQAQAVYERGLALGIPKELARLPLPVGRYSRMRASANLRNWLNFLRLRLASNAQHEIRLYAGAVAALTADAFPRTYQLFLETA